MSEESTIAGGTPLERRIIGAGTAIVVVGLAVASAWLAFGGGGTGIDQWLPVAVLVAVGLGILACGGAVRTVSREMWPAGVALSAFLALTLLALTSVVWTPSPSLTVAAAALWALTAGAFGLTILTVRSPSAAHGTVAAIVGVSTAVALAVEYKLLDGDGGIFVGNRLAWPIDYANANAALAFIGVPGALGLALAARSSVLLRTAFVAGGGFLLSVGTLTASRGGVLALLLAWIVLVILSRQRLPAVMLSLAVVVGTAVSWHGLLSGTAVASDRGRSVLAATGVSALLGLLVATAMPRVLSAWDRGAIRLAGTVAAVAALGAVVFGLIARFGSPISIARHAWGQFSGPAGAGVLGASPAARLLGAQSNRYDYWRVAWNVWRAHPLLGYGAGSYPVAWYRQRTINENVTDPHGWPFRLAAEQGAIGVVVFGLVIVALVIAAVSIRRMASSAGSIGAAAAACAAYFIAHSAVDWMMAIVPVLLLGLLAMAATFGVGYSPPANLGGLRLHVGTAVVALFLLVLFVPLWLSSKDVARAESSPDPRVALGILQSAHRLAPWDVQPLQVAAEIRLSAGDTRGAVRVLNQALAMEPLRWELWQELQQADSAGGRMGSAQFAERKTRSLNPLAGR